jgi:hypothetical protein
MYSKKYIESRLMEHFSPKEVFSRDQLFAFFRTLDPDLKESTFTWRIFDLKKRHRIRDVGKGVYTIEQKQLFKPDADGVINKIGSFLDNSFTHHYYNVWTTSWLNEFVDLQATSFLYILEVDKMSIEQVFFSMKDSSEFSHVFINPDGAMINHYISELPQAIVLVPMISRAPTMTVKKIILPTLEKILVDLYCDPKLYFAYQGQQLVKIFEAALSKYVINYSRLLNYAKRRHREDTLKEFLLEQSGLQNEVLSAIV